MTVRVGRQIDRHAGNKCREVGAVVKVETAQEVLIGLAFARVLGDDHAGDELKHFTGARCGPGLE